MLVRSSHRRRFVRWVRSLAIDANLSLLFKRCREDVHANWDCDWNWELCVFNSRWGGVRYHHQRSWAGWTPALSLFGGLAININGLCWVVSVSCVWIEFLALGSIRCVVGSVQISIYIYLMLYIHTHSHTQTRSCNRLFALIFPALFAGTVKFEFN